MKLNWKNKKLIGKGGNGKVYRIEDAEGKTYAVKVLTRAKNNKAYQRFKDEVKILKQLGDSPGVIKVFKYNLPDNISEKNRPYYVMPLAKTLEEYLWSKTYTQFYSIVLKLAETLVQLHELDITHRDIKPDNILIVDSLPVFSDFGLAHFPKKKKVSNLKERIGAVWTIAPEMKRISSTAQFKKADVYSFAKTLWILITKEKLGFEGQYVLKSSISIDNFVDLKINNHYGSFGEWRYESLVLLESLFIDATDNDPNNRPDAYDFASRLTTWYNTSSVFAKRNNYEWEHCLTRIFPVSIPESSSWTNLKEVNNILKLISKEYDQLNYAFLPEHGGIDITDIKLAQEENCLIINDYYIVRPKKLTFESLGNLDFSYFYLELAELKAIKENQENNVRETLYIEKNDEYSEMDTILNKRVQRYLRGSVIITRKTSILNKIRGDFDGHLGVHHNKSPDQYKSMIKRLLRVFKNTGN